MKLFVSVLGMHSHHRLTLAKPAFTLIEVMIAVMIISVVIAALLQMRGNSTFLFINMNKKSQVNQFATFFVDNDKYGYENTSTSLDELVSEFDMENDLRRELKNNKIELIYQELKVIDMADFVSDDTQESYEDEASDGVPTMIFELGKTILKTKDSSVALLRIKRQ